MLLEKNINIFKKIRSNKKNKSIKNQNYDNTNENITQDNQQDICGLSPQRFNANSLNEPKNPSFIQDGRSSAGGRTKTADNLNLSEKNKSEKKDLCLKSIKINLKESKINLELSTKPGKSVEKDNSMLNLNENLTQSGNIIKTQNKRENEVSYTSYPETKQFEFDFKSLDNIDQNVRSYNPILNYQNNITNSMPIREEYGERGMPIEKIQSNQYFLHNRQKFYPLLGEETHLRSAKGLHINLNNKLRDINSKANEQGTD